MYISLLEEDNNLNTKLHEKQRDIRSKCYTLIFILSHRKQL